MKASAMCLGLAALLASTASSAASVLVRLDRQADFSGTRARSGDQRAQEAWERLHSVARASADALLPTLSARGITVQRRFTVVNALLVEADAAQQAWLRQQPEVAALTLNRRFRVELPTDEPVPLGPVGLGRAPEASLNLLRVPQVWALGVRGAGVVVASKDTGVLWTHPALIGKYRGSAGNHAYHWHDAIHSTSISSCAANSPAPCDDNSHGTHTVGTMVGEDGANQVGIAPDAKWIGCRNMDAGNGTPATYLECMDFMLAPTDANGANPRPDLAPHIINNSWGCPLSEGCDAVANGLLQTAVENLRNAGILFVGAAGNAGSGCSSINDAPAMFAATLTVANTTVTDLLAGSSSRGPVLIDGSNRRKPDVAAPGTSIRSTVLGNGYGSKSGTSMASPHIAGVAALVMSANPALQRNPEAVEQIIKSSVVQITTPQSCGGIAGTTWPNNQVGHGRIDALRAVEAAQALAAVLMANGFE